MPALSDDAPTFRITFRAASDAAAAFGFAVPSTSDAAALHLAVAAQVARSSTVSRTEKTMSGSL